MAGFPPQMPPDGGAGGPPPQGEPNKPSVEALGQLSAKGGQGGSLLQLILTFLAGAGLRDVAGTLKQLSGGGKTAQQKGKQQVGPAAPPPMAAMPPGQLGQGPQGQPNPQQLQQLLALLAAKGGQGGPQG